MPAELESTALPSDLPSEGGASSVLLVMFEVSVADQRQAHMEASRECMLIDAVNIARGRRRGHARRKAAMSDQCNKRKR